MAVVKETSKPILSLGTPEEIIFKAEYFHNLSIIRRSNEGLHYIDFHNNPLLTPPPLRGDGRTRCDACCMQMAPYADLSIVDQARARDLVMQIPRAEEAWRKFREGK